MDIYANLNNGKKQAERCCAGGSNGCRVHCVSLDLVSSQEYLRSEPEASESILQVDVDSKMIASVDSLREVCFPDFNCIPDLCILNI